MSWSRVEICPKVLFALFAVLPLCACASGHDLAKTEVDDTLHTSSVTTESVGATDAVRLSDVAIIRSAVSSADLEQGKGRALFWANAETGSRGSITGLVEYKDRDTLCRRFRTTRESFDGVAMFSGDTCLAPAGAWRMRAFDAL